MPGVPPSRYAFLGPASTFCEAALRQVPAAAAGQTEPMPTVDAALEAVRSGEVTAAMVPIENSVEGGVPATLDALTAGDTLMVTREVLVPVRFVLAARPGTGLGEVRRIASHPHGWAQCRGWVAEHVPAATYVPALSTASAAQGLEQAGDAGYDAALCAPIAAERYRLAVLADDVGDNPNAVTRFVLVSRFGPPPPPTGADRTTLVAFIPDDHPGALLELLEQFAARGVNLSRIESRPTGGSLGQYCFSIDAEGHVGEPRVGEALMGLRRVCPDVRFLGSYPRADGVPSRPRPGTDERAFTDAGAWLARLRDGRA